MPTSIQEAYETLGFTSEIWNTTAEETNISVLEFEELTKEQKDAVITIGYTKASWDAEN